MQDTRIPGRLTPTGHYPQTRCRANLDSYRRKRDFSATPEPSGGAEAAGRSAPRGSSSRSTTRAPCTGTCGSSATARWPRGRCPRASRRTRAATTSRSAPRTTRSSTSTSTATSRRASTAPGTMKIWDRGTYETHKWREDEVMVTFHGERVRGRYVLFRTDGTNWMIHRMDPPEDPDREPMPKRIEPMLARTGELPEGRRELGVRDQVGRRAGDRLRRRRPPAARGAQRARHHAALPGAARARARAGGPRGDRRRRGGGLRRRAAELPEAPGPHAPDLREPRSAGSPRATRSTT